MIGDEIANYLVSYGIGTLSQNLFIGEIPAQLSTGVPTPHDVVRVWPYGGSPPEHVKDRSNVVMEVSRFQIATRSKSYQAAQNRAYQCLELLSGYSGVLSSVSYASIRALQMPEQLPRDEEQRVVFVTNYEVRKEPSPIS